MTQSPARKILVAVKLLPTVDDKTFDHVDMKITFSADRPNPEDVREELLSAAYLLPALSGRRAQRRRCSTKAIRQVDIAALDSAQAGALTPHFARRTPPLRPSSRSCRPPRST